MAAIENLQIVVDVDISSAIAELEKLQEELRDIAETIEEVDALGKEGIDIRTNVDDLDTELARLLAEIEAFEAAASIDIPTRIGMNRALPSPGGGAVGALPEPDIAGALPAPPGGTRGPLFPNLSRAVGKVTSKFGGLQRRLDNFDLRMSDIHNLMATLIPLLVIFIGAMPAVITAVIGLAAAAVTAAAALASLGALGALGMALEGGQVEMQNLRDAWEQIKQDFIDAFAPLAERLQPLFEDGLDALGAFFQQIANQGDALMELTDEARAFGQFIMDFVPPALRTLAALVEALAPALSDIGRAIEQNFNYFMRELTRLTMQALPAVSDFVQTIIAALPTLVELGIQFTRVATGVLRFIGLLWRVITLNGALDGVMGTLIATLLVAATAFSLLNKAAIRFILVGMKGAIISLYRFMTGLALASTQMSIFGSTMLANALSAAISFTAGIIQSAVALVGFSLSAYQAAIAAAAFWTAVTLGAAAFLVPMITSMATGFLGLSENIDAATSSLKEFDRVSSRTSGGFNPYGGDDPPDSGAGAASSGGGSKTVINIESSGDPDEDKSNARYVSFRQGRTTGGEN